MAGFRGAFEHLRNELTSEEVGFLKDRCREHLLSRDDSIPCYAMIDHLDAGPFLKIKERVEASVGARVRYLNDFYLYTDGSFGAGWHMDTELFTFRRALNAWILLAPDVIRDPVCFMRGINDSPDRQFHGVEIEGNECVFSNYATRKQEARSLESVENERIHTPKIESGDVLLIDPRHFHRTQGPEPKHCFVIKFVHGEEDDGLLSSEQVSGVLWPETRIFNRLLKGAESWDGVLDGVRQELTTRRGREALSAGFYPDRIALFRRMVAAL